MKFSALFAAAAIAVLATPALAAAPVIVKLAQPVAAKTNVIAGGAIFTCAGDSCVAASPTEETTDVRACKIVVHAVGEAVSFGTSAKPLPADRLAACNEAAKK